jgi:ribonuclease HI
MIKIYTDGGYSRKQDSGSWGWAISKKEFDSGQVKGTTNNRMELVAVIRAIIYAKSTYSDKPIKVYSDSKYCVNGFSEWMYNWQSSGWTKKGGLLNEDLWRTLYSLRSGVELEWVKGHSDNDMNNFVDSLCINY